uniref:Xray repair crosscomplementing protein 5like [Strongylocentrotus purpuratus] n=1 Tax=Lepeophtheirus salmonis TaxID=72036 RepID=A0A0K2UUL8_LEPSM
MGPKIEIDAICLLIDVGPSSSRSGYLEQAKNAAMSLIERKMFSEAKDRFALVLFGSQETDNSMDYEGVKVVRDVWGPASFELLRYLELKVGGESEKGSDWLDAIVVGLDYLKDKAPQANKKIVLMSDLATPCNEDQFEVIVTNMENENAELCFFGPEWDESGTSQGPSTSNRRDDDPPPSHSTKKPQSLNQISASDLLNQMVERTDGIFCNVEEAMLNLLYKERKNKKPFPWRVVLEIGPNIRISTTGYIAVRREPVKSWKKCLARPTDESSYELKPEVSYVRKDDNEKTVEANNLIESYKYGSKLITVSEEDRANFHYEGGGKSLKVIGFIKKDQIPNQYLLGNGNMAFLPTENDPHSSTALSAIILSMVELGRAALVRKVYRAKTTPRMGILVPEIITPEDDEESDETYRLIFIELPYAEDVRKFTFLSLYTNTSRPSEDQLNAMDKYIDAALLEDEEFQTESIPNPCNQYLYRCLSHRALNPGRVLPDVDVFIKKLFDTPERVTSGTREVLEEMLNLFPLEELKDANKGKKRKM